jgi:formyltetrahydrofolate synthetase
MDLVRDYSLKVGADYAVAANHWARGGEGAVDLAKAVIEACKDESQFKFLYDLELSLEEKINVIAKEMYGADGIELSDEAKEEIARYTRQGKCSAGTEWALADLDRLLCFAHLYGQDCPVVVRRPIEEGCPDRLHLAYPQRPSLCRRFVRLPVGR